jgi:peptidoglycan/LPS O-acetylase OafA/YrhL
MNALSTLATIISVLSFPLIFVALMYPHLAGTRGRWYGVCLYGAISIGMLLVAVVTSPDPQVGSQEWTWLDWLVIAFGGGGMLVYITRKYSSFKKQVLANRELEKQKKNKGGGKSHTRKKKTHPG